MAFHIVEIVMELVLFDLLTPYLVFKLLIATIVMILLFKIF